ncbi:MAG TPA: transposase [Pyrinomonadaceae bacterium]|jgi:REP element-mobilizing transposase RayT|nr:transposase [Pyrinomonadaceae bacterium]
MSVLTMFYRRHLPHWQKADSALFITWRLHGSLPRRTVVAGLTESNPGKRFLLLDRELDRAAYGPTWLKDVRVAKMLVESLLYGADHLQLYRLCAYAVMSNHVHILIWPTALLPRITKAIKGFTAHEANRIPGRTGEKFWQDESFDHSVRNEDQFYRIMRYVERNPVKAGLVESVEQWPWSSAARS